MATQYVWGERLYPLQDALFNVVALADDTGAVKERFAYLPYGQSEELNPNFTEYTGVDYEWEYRFTGRELDLESGLQLNRNRYLHQQLGRWVSRDPIGYLAGSGNLSNYVADNPLNHLDQSGLKPVGKFRVWKFGQLFGDSLTNSEMILHWLPPDDWDINNETCLCSQVGLYQIASTTKLWSIRNNVSQQPWHHDRIRVAAEVDDWPNPTYDFARLKDTPGFDPISPISLLGTFVGLRQSFETCAVCTDNSSNRNREIFGCVHWGHRIDYNANRVPNPWLKIYLLGPP